MNNLILKLVLSILITSFSFISLAEEKIPLSAYGTLPQVSLMTISPSGKYVGFRKIIANKDMFLIYDIAKNKVIRSLNIDKTKPQAAYFVKDDQLILVTGMRQQTWGFWGTGPQDTRYALGYNITKNKVYRLLTPGEGIYDNQWGLSYISGISNDFEFAYMPAWVGGGTQRSLMRTRLGAKRKPSTYVKGTEFTKKFIVVNDKVLAREEYDNKEDLYYIQAYRNKEWETIYSKKTKIRLLGVLGVTPDHKHLVINRSSGDKKHFSLYTLSLKDGELSDTPLFSRDDADVEEVITDINKIVYGVKYSGFLPSYEFFDEGITKRFDAINKSFANTAVHIKDWSNGWKQLLVYIEGQESSGEYITVNEKNEMNIVGEARPLIPYNKVHPISTFNYTAQDGLKISSLMTYPKSWDGKSKIPTIVAPHGNGDYDQIKFNWMVQYFAEQGYLVIQPQYRGSYGFGDSHRQKGYGEWGKKVQTDLNDALNVLVKKGMADPDHVCIVGGNFGGYAALAAGAFTPDIYKCVVSYNGVSDLALLLDNKRIKFGKDSWVLAYWDRELLKSEERNPLFEEISPIHHASSFKVPVLLIHSEHNEYVDFEQSDSMHSALLEAGKQSTLVELKKDDNKLSFSKTRLQALEEISSFVKEHI